MRALAGIIGAAALLVSAQAAYAVSITNGSFEAGPVQPSAGGYATFNGVDTTSITGWTVDSGSVDLIDNGYWAAADGHNSIDMDGHEAGTISQKISGLTAGQEYKVTFSIASNNAVFGQTVSLDVSTDEGLKSISYTAPGGTTSTNMNWATAFYTFIAAGTSTTLSFASTFAGASGAALDNVQIAATPLPASILMLLTALGGMGFVGYRRRNLSA